ncbi:hypothetical protein L917_08934 [Phytophthora nicotianae]|uniref:Uncharacterized protein n=1 Tax=Phytophthora nicotianae TaxID=4792 RepID=W2L626_PHYNI|nr:hypothetical protein L917_08934 [Phytophthora nicotianae]
MTSNSAAAKVTAERTKLFKQSLTGKLGEDEFIETAEVQFLSMSWMIAGLKT